MKITKFAYFFFVFYVSQRTEKSHIKEDKYLYISYNEMYVCNGIDNNYFKSVQLKNE